MLSGTITCLVAHSPPELERYHTLACLRRPDRGARGAWGDVFTNGGAYCSIDGMHNELTGNGACAYPNCLGLSMMRILMPNGYRHGSFLVLCL